MKFFRLLALTLALALVGGCATFDDYAAYYRVRVTDPRGILIADWVAKGAVLRIEGGYRFRAVERLSGGPWPKLVRYPHGRVVEATGPNIIVSRIHRPAWLETTTAEEVRVVDRSKDL